jgi:L-threonylcarbamoyladenylate synthase
MTNTPFSEEYKRSFLRGEVFAYPTEAVFGLGCDPRNEKAVMTLLRLKQRPVHKGLILIASSQQQLIHFADFASLSQQQLDQVSASWPGPFTWLVPKKPDTPDYLTGGSNLIAVRVSAHPIVTQLCEFLGSAIVSTSANLSGQEPARNPDEVKAQFGNSMLCIAGQVGEQRHPSQIRNALTGDLVRVG